jgi:hypothetical protein
LYDISFSNGFYKAKFPAQSPPCCSSVPVRSTSKYNCQRPVIMIANAPEIHPHRKLVYNIFIICPQLHPGVIFIPAIQVC